MMQRCAMNKTCSLQPSQVGIWLQYVNHRGFRHAAKSTVQTHRYRSNSAALCLRSPRCETPVADWITYFSSFAGKRQPVPRVNAVTLHPEVGFLDEWSDSLLDRSSMLLLKSVDSGLRFLKWSLGGAQDTGQSMPSTRSIMALREAIHSRTMAIGSVRRSPDTCAVICIQSSSALHAKMVWQKKTERVRSKRKHSVTKSKCNVACHAASPCATLSTLILSLFSAIESWSCTKIDLALQHHRTASGFTMPLCLDTVIEYIFCKSAVKNIDLWRHAVWRWWFEIISVQHVCFSLWHLFQR